MPFEQHKEKNYPKDAQSIYQAALKATENWRDGLSPPSQGPFVSPPGFQKSFWGKLLASCG